MAQSPPDHQSAYEAWRRRQTFDAHRETVEAADRLTSRLVIACYVLGLAAALAAGFAFGIVWASRG